MTFKLLIYMGVIVCGMQKHEFAVNQLLCTNSHGAAGEGCTSLLHLQKWGFEGTAGETNPKKDWKKEYTFKKNVPSQSIGPARMPFMPVRAVRVEAPCLHGTHC